MPSSESFRLFMDSPLSIIYFIGFWIFYAAMVWAQDWAQYGFKLLTDPKFREERRRVKEEEKQKKILSLFHDIQGHTKRLQEADSAKYQRFLENLNQTVSPLPLDSKGKGKSQHL